MNNLTINFNPEYQYIKSTAKNTNTAHFCGAKEQKDTLAAPKEEKTPKKINKKLIVGSALALVTFGGVALFALSKGKAKTQPCTPALPANSNKNILETIADSKETALDIEPLDTAQTIEDTLSTLKDRIAKIGERKNFDIPGLKNVDNLKNPPQECIDALMKLDKKTVDAMSDEVICAALNNGQELGQGIIYNDSYKIPGRIAILGETLTADEVSSICASRNGNMALYSFLKRGRENILDIQAKYANAQ